MTNQPPTNVPGPDTAASAQEPVATAVAFDFRTKECPSIEPSDARGAMDAGRFVWIDVNLARADEARRFVESLGLCPADLFEDAQSREPATQIARYEEFLAGHALPAAVRRWLDPEVVVDTEKLMKRLRTERNF